MAALCFSKIALTRVMGRNARISHRLIVTSEKKKEVSHECPSPESIYKKVPDFSKPLLNKNWVSFGFDHEDKDLDRYLAHFSMFISITVVFCGVGFILMYYPDRSKMDWAQREAFIRLYEREQLGLEPIDPNYVDPSKIILPPDEELEEHEIII